jgi:hypothetical protein
MAWPQLVVCLRPDFRETCPVCTVVLPIQSTAGFDDLS